MTEDKSTMLTLWQEIGELIYPTQQNFSRYFVNQHKGAKRRRPIFDPTGENSNDIFASSLVGLVANPASKWVAFQSSITELNQDREVQLFLDEAQRQVLEVFNNPRTKFYDNLFTTFKMIGAFGSGMLMMDEDDDAVVKFRAESPRNFDFTEDFSGGIHEVFFEREFTVAALKHKKETAKWDIPKRITDMHDNEKVIVIRHIEPNDGFNPDKLGGKFAKFHSKYYLKQDKKLIHKGFFSVNPTAIGRWDRLDGEKWPDSPGRVALGNVKLMQAADRAMTVAMEKELKPTLFVSSEAKFGKLDTSAGVVNVGRGNPNDMVREMRTNGQGVLAAFEWMEVKRQQIRTAFYVDIFQTAQVSGSTATEAQIRNQERLRGVAPKATKVQSDLLGPAAEKVLEARIKRGELIVPEKLAQAGGEIKIVYLSPLAQAQRLEDANTMLQFFQDISGISEVFPEVLDIIDADAAVQEMADIRGVPEKILREAKQIQQLREAKAQQAQQQQQIEQAKQVGEAGQSLQALEQQPLQ
jgi:hypothetical protein